MSRKHNKAVNKAVLSVTAAAVMAFPVLPIMNVGVSYADTAASYVTLNSFSGHPDVSLTVSGGNYTPNESIKLVATQDNTQVATATTNASQSGQFSAHLQLPAKLAQGNVQISATGSTSGLVSNNGYYVTPFTPSLKASASDTIPYGSLTVSGSGYAPDEKVDLNFAGTTTIATTNGNGAFSAATVKTPNVPAASYKIVGAGEASGASAVAYEYVNGFYPSAAPSSYYVMPAASLGFTGSGFAPNETVNVSDADSGTKVSSFTTDKNGSFTDAGSFVVPASYAGLTKKFVLTGTTSDATTTTSTAIGQYYPNVSPTSYYVLPGKTISFNGSGFVPGETVDITNGQTNLGSVIADSKGDLTAAGVIATTSTQAGTTQNYTLTGETSHGAGSVSVQVGSYNPQASPSGYYLMPGSALTFEGSGFAPSETVTIFSATQTNLGSFATDGLGAFKSAGNITIGYDQANSSASYSLVGAISNKPIDFTVGIGHLNALLSPSSYYVLPSAPFSVSATGFAPNEKINLNSGSTLLATTTTTALGTGTFTNVALPYSGLGSATLTASGVLSKATATATVGIGSYNPSVVSSNYYAKPGDTVTLTSSGFAPSESVTVTAGATTKMVNADAKGTFTTNLVLPFGQTKSSLDIVSVGSISHATNTTTITLAPYMPQVSPSTYYATPGTAITFTGSGFAPNESLSLSLNDANIGTEKADAKGNFTSTGTYILPFAKSASYVFTGAVSGGSSTMNIGLAQFYAGVQLNSYYGNGGSSVTASGSGFAPNETVSLTAGTTSLGSVVASSKGAFSKAITIPYAKPGSVPITATGALSGASPTTGYTVAQVYNSVGLGSYAVKAGKAVTITGSGFFANEPITVTNDRNSTIYSFKADSNGNLNNSGLVLPTSFATGNLKLTITGSESYTTHAITLYVQDANAQ